MARTKPRHRGAREISRVRQRQSTRGEGDRPSRAFLTPCVVAFIVGVGLTTMTFLALSPSSDSPRSDLRTIAQAGTSSAEAGSLGDLASLSPEGIANCDIARLNLLAAEGLPGAEGLNVERSIADLNRWAARVRSETDRHLYKYASNPASFENSEAYFRVLMLITVLQQDLGVHYNPDRIDDPDFTNSRDLFLNGMVGSDNGGTCVSMPVLYVAVGRRLGYPLKLVVTKGHVFARWEDDRDRFNIEGAGLGLTTQSDGHYTTWPHELDESEINNGWFLRSLAPAEELAVFLMQRGHCLEDNGRLHEAQVAYALAHRFAPSSPEALVYLTELIRKDTAEGRSAPAVQSARASQQAWLKQKRREAEEIARQAVERK